MPNYRVSVAFVNLRDAEFTLFARGVATGLAEHADFFAAPLVPVAAINMAADEFRVATLAASGGGKILTLIKQEKRVALEELLRREATYVQGLASQDLMMLLASGFRATNTNRAQSPLDMPRIRKLDYGLSTEFVLTIHRVRNAKSYEVQVESSGDWNSIGVFGTTRHIFLRGFTPGQIYNFRIRAVGGSTGYSQWSDPVTRMAL